MARNRAEQIRLIRDRLIERAAAGSPEWAVPVLPSARLTANALMTGCLLNRLPDEDASALCKTIIEEQNENGSWSRTSGDGGDISATLEILHALSVSKRPESRPALNRAVEWLEANRAAHTIEWETMLLLGAVTETHSRFPRSLINLIKHNPLRELFGFEEPRSRSLSLAYRLLSKEQTSCLGQYSDLLQLQRTDGSWDGLARTTLIVLTALRHCGLSLEDTAIERGWRFLRGHQHWSTYGLAQNPSDFSALLHAAAIRSLAAMGAPVNSLAGSVLSLLHSQRATGGWGLGAQLPTDVFTTSLVLDALTMVGDAPLETAWAQRRASMLLLRAQRRDGGWSLHRKSQDIFYRHPLIGGYASDVEVTAIALIALSGAPGFAVSLPARRKAVKFLSHHQREDGLWSGTLSRNDLFATARAIEALSAADPDGSRRAVLKAMKALRERQHENGGWGLRRKPSASETAWAVRALQRVPGLYKQSISRARSYLMTELDESGLVWCSEPALFPIPYGGDKAELWDLTTMWVLEAFSPAPLRTPRRASLRAKTIFNKRADR